MRVINLFCIEFIFNFLYNYQRIIQLKYTLAQKKKNKFLDVVIRDTLVALMR